MDIKCTNGDIAIVDNEDYPLVANYRWYVVSPDNDPTRKYAHTSVKDDAGAWRTVYMHQMIVGPHCAPTIDHEDRNGLNNHRSNLRPATRSQQSMNQGLRSNNTSGFKGVSWARRERRWEAYIHLYPRRKRRLGYYRTAEEAAIAYDRAAMEIFGEFARTNFPCNEGA